MFSNYIKLIEKIDLRSAEVHRQWRRHMACRKGCDGCCRHIAVFPVEAAYLAKAVACLPAAEATAVRIRARNTPADGPCPLLIDGACQVYAARPLICRTQGLPLLIRRETDVQIDFCPLNFQGITRLPSDIVTDLERLNDILAAVNIVFLKQVRPAVPIPGRISIAEALCQSLLDSDPRKARG